MPKGLKGVGLMAVSLVFLLNAINRMKKASH